MFGIQNYLLKAPTINMEVQSRKINTIPILNFVTYTIAPQ